jgi:hypothetical protein
VLQEHWVQNVTFAPASPQVATQATLAEAATPGDSPEFLGELAKKEIVV